MFTRTDVLTSGKGESFLKLLDTFGYTTTKLFGFGVIKVLLKGKTTTVEFVFPSAVTSTTIVFGIHSPPTPP